MSTAYTVTEFDPYRTRIYTWGPLASGEIGVTLAIPRHADKSVHVKGNLDGGLVSIKGCNFEDGSQFDTLADAFNDLLDVNAAAKKIRTIIDNPLFIRPEAGGGGGAMGAIVALVVRV